MHAPGIPTITYGLRGLTFMEIELVGPDRDLHSGSFGGAIANPINELAKIIAKLHSKNGKVTIPNFYKDVIPFTKTERENIRKLRYSNKGLANFTGGFEFRQGFNQPLRSYNIDDMDYVSGSRVDLYFGIKISWNILFYKRMSNSYYYN